MSKTDVQIVDRYIRELMVEKADIVVRNYNGEYYNYINGEPRIPATVFEAIYSRRLEMATAKIAALTAQMEKRSKNEKV